MDLPEVLDGVTWNACWVLTGMWMFQRNRTDTDGESHDEFDYYRVCGRVMHSNMKVNMAYGWQDVYRVDCVVLISRIIFLNDLHATPKSVFRTDGVLPRASW